MKTLNFVIFFSIVLTIYGLLNFYIFIRGWQSIPEGSTMRSAYAFLFWILALSFVGGRILERFWTSALSDLLVWMGSFWIAAMFYFFLTAVLLDLLRLADVAFRFFPPLITDHYSQAKYIVGATAIAAVSILLIAGHINASIPRVRILDLSIDKKVEGLSAINIVAASDIHLGTIVGRHRLEHIVEQINGLNPDLVLLPGDIVDEDLAPVIKHNLGEALWKIKSRFGIYAITGNHEYIGGAEEACTYLGSHNVTLLRDNVTKVNDWFYLVGREDRSRRQFTGFTRKPLAELMTGIDMRAPVLLMDHQPFELNEAVRAGIDLQLSGHTHQGQLWPVNYLIRAIFEVGWGYKRIAGTHIYVSNGVGSWGPPVRIGNRPEIVNIRLRFK